METQNTSKIARIGIEDIKKHMDEFVFVDARSVIARSRNPLQIPGAIHVPAKDVDKASKDLPKKRTLVTYCT